MMTKRLLASLCALLLCSAATACAGEKVWGALVFATQSDEPAEIPAELAPYADKLEGVFGYNQFRLVGQETKELKAAEEQWLIPSERFYVRIVARDRKGPGCLLDLQLYNTKKLLVETHAELGPQSPLFIRGAQCARGQLIIVLVIR
jgi:hypothetical protein